MNNLEQIIIDFEDAEGFRKAFNSDYEYGGYLVGEQTPEGIKIIHGRIKSGKENSASVNYIPPDVWNIYQSDPHRYLIIPVHAHCRRLGEIIQKYDPYWSVSNKSVREPAGSVVDEFYISPEPKADNDVMEASRKIGMNYALFIHPQLNSEGTVMTENKIKFTGYKYDSQSIGKVKEIPVKIQ